MKNVATLLFTLAALATVVAPVDARLRCRRVSKDCHQVVAPKIDLKHGGGIHMLRCRHNGSHLHKC